MGDGGDACPLERRFAPLVPRLRHGIVEAGPTNRLGPRLRDQGLQNLERLSPPEDQAGSDPLKIRGERQYRPLQPPAGCSPKRFGLRVQNEDGDDRATILASRNQRRMVRQSQIAAQPEQGWRVGHEPVITVVGTVKYYTPPFRRWIT